MREQYQEIVLNLESGFHEEAIDKLQVLAVSEDPDDQFFAASIYLNLGWIEEASELLRNLHEEFPDDEETTILYAEVLFETDERDEAIHLLNEFDEESPFYAHALLTVADFYQAEGLDEVAEQKLLLARDVAPENYGVRFALAEWYVYTGEFEMALSVYERLMDHADADVDNIYSRMALCFEMTFRYEDAATYYSKVEEHRLTMSMRYHYALTLVQLERVGEAKAQLEELLKKDENNVDALVLIGRLFEDEANLEEAKKYLEKAYRIFDGDATIPFLLARISYREQDLPVCTSYLKEALEKNAHHFESILLLARVYIEEEAYGSVIQLLEPLIEEGEDDPSVLWMLALSYWHNDEILLALKYYKLAYTFYTDNVYFLEEYAIALRNGGYRKEALQIIEQLLAHDPHHEEAGTLFDELSNDDI
ncbi:MAG: tetratricopeptide repeat protein [Bacilli bacterium]